MRDGLGTSRLSTGVNCPPASASRMPFIVAASFPLAYLKSNRNDSRAKRGNTSKYSECRNTIKTRCNAIQSNILESHYTSAPSTHATLPSLYTNPDPTRSSHRSQTAVCQATSPSPPYPHSSTLPHHEVLVSPAYIYNLSQNKSTGISRPFLANAGSAPRL